MELAEDMYREELLECYRNPQNYGRIDRPSVSYRDFNPVCGDEVEVHLRMESGKIAAIGFTGRGCAISQAAASLVTENVKGKSADYARRMKKEKMLDLMPIEVSSLRIKCALLAMKAIQKAIAKHDGGAGNERT